MHPQLDGSCFGHIDHGSPHGEDQLSLSMQPLTQVAHEMVVVDCFNLRDVAPNPS